MPTDRYDALRVFEALVERAENPAFHEDIEAWMAARMTGEGGFLWLAGMLHMRPSVLEASIRKLLEGTLRDRQTVQRRLKRIAAP